MSRWIELELGDTLYELEVVSFEPPDPPRGWDPGDGGEIELGDEVRVYSMDFVPTGPGSGKAVPRVEELISLSDFIKIYADQGSEDDLRQAERDLLDECFGIMLDKLEDDFPDT